MTNQMYWEIELKPPQHLMLIDNDQPEEEVDFVNNQLISMLNNSVQVYYKYKWQSIGEE